jgi:hypothetical protein
MYEFWRAGALLDGGPMSTNPWVTGPEPSTTEPVEMDAPAPSSMPAGLDLAPQPASVSAPRHSFPRLSVDDAAGPSIGLWWFGTHGGAGESTLEQLLEGSRGTCHAWPQVDESASLRPNVILVARTSARGLRSAQIAATEWAAGDVAVQLHGLVLIADAPGRLPKPLKDFARIVAGGVPRVWRLPWVEEWRLGATVSAATAPKAVTDFLEQLRAAIQGDRTLCFTP